MGRTTPQRRRRLAASMGVPALLLVLMVPPAFAQSSDGDMDPVTNPHDACPDDVNPRSPFTDRDTVASVHVLNVDCAYNNDITVGFDDNTFRPRPPVTRGQFASFLVRTLRASGVELPPASPQGFRDIAGSGHTDSINILAATGIAQGTTSTTYAPGAPLTREQTATFAMRAAAHIQGIPLSSIQRPTGPFSDIGEASSAHVANINGAAHFKVTTGVTASLYEPQRYTSRQQMASFLVRILGSLRDGGVLIPPEEIVEKLAFPNDFAVNPVGTNHTASALATDFNGAPVANARIRFEVFRHANVTLAASPLHSDANFEFQPSLTATRTTNASGIAAYTYTGPDFEADDRIAACVVRGPVDNVPTSTPVCGIPVSVAGAVQNVIPNSAIPSAVSQKIWGFPAGAIDVDATGLRGQLLGVPLVATPNSSISLPAQGALAEDSDGVTLGVVQNVLEAGVLTTRAAGDLNYGMARAESTLADVSLGLGPAVPSGLCALLPALCTLLNQLVSLDLVGAQAIDVTAHATCRGPFEDLDDASDINFVNTTILGNTVAASPLANTGITLGPAFSAVVNEVVPIDEPGRIGYHVTALRITLLDAQLISQLGGAVDIRLGETTTSLQCPGFTGSVLEAAGLDAQQIENDEHINWVSPEELAGTLE